MREISSELKGDLLAGKYILIYGIYVQIYGTYMLF
jgi:hypothetical protein